MAEKEKLLKVKAQLKKRQPQFIRADAHKRKKLGGAKWRKPKGLHNKMRDGKKGYRAKLQEGYRTPNAVRGMTKDGLYPTVVSTGKELAALDPKVHSIILAGTLGGRKKITLIEEAKRAGFTVADSSEKTVERIKAKVKAHHEQRTQREQEKKDKEAAAEKAAAKKAAQSAAEKAPEDSEKPAKADKSTADAEKSE